MTIAAPARGFNIAGNLAGKVALITGSTSGIGLGIARAMAQAGASVVLNGLGAAEEIERLRAELEATYATKVLYSPADMSKPRCREPSWRENIELRAKRAINCENISVDILIIDGLSWSPELSRCT